MVDFAPGINNNLRLFDKCYFLINVFVLQMSKLCKELDEIWLSNEFSEIIFMWSQFLKEEALPLLNISKTIELDNDSSTSSDIDQRAICDLPKACNLFLTLIEHDTQQQKLEFESNSYNCQICFEEKLGSNCIKLIPCFHVYCKNCIRTFFEVQIQNYPLPFGGQ